MDFFCLSGVNFIMAFGCAQFIKAVDSLSQRRCPRPTEQGRVAVGLSYNYTIYQSEYNT